MRLILTFAGTEASGFIKFIVDSFGGAKEYSQAEAEAALHIAMGDSEPEDAAELEVEASLYPKDTSSEVRKDVCSLKDAKPFFPTDPNAVSCTGVPVDCVSDNVPMGPSRQSTYYCMFGECDAMAHQKALMMNHVR